MATRLVRRLVAIAAATLLAAAILPTPVAAHAEYQRSSPPAGGALQAAPPRLDVWFTQELFRRAGENRLTVTSPDGQLAHTGDAVIDDADRKHLSIALKANLPAGTYTVAWASLSAQDGEHAEGTFSFRIDPRATPALTATTAPTVTAPTAAPASPERADAERPSIPWWAVGGAVSILLSAGVVAVTILRGERQP